MTNKNKFIGAALATGILFGGLNLQAADAIGYDEAVNIALKNFPNSYIKDVELDKEFNGTFYEISSFKDGDEKEIKIDASNGKIVKEKIERGKHSRIDFSSVKIAINDARKKAMDASKDWEFKKIELDNELGKTVYEVELRQGLSEKKIIIDAVSGEIVHSYVK